MTENVVAFIFGIIFGGILATSIYSWIPYFKKEKGVINHIFDEYHEIETLKLNERDYYDKFMRNKGYYVKSEDESSIIYQNSYGIDYIKVSKAKFKEEPKMKIYHTETQGDYNALMVEFEKEGVTWVNDGLPAYQKIKGYPYIVLINKTMEVATLDFVHERYSNIPIIEYKANDTVNNPSHYNTGGIETLDYIKAKVKDYPSYAVGNIMKYITRYEHKNGIEDLKKAQFYLNDLIKWMEGDK